MDLLSGSNWCVRAKLTQGQLTFDLSRLNVRQDAIIIYPILAEKRYAKVCKLSMDPLSTLGSVILVNHVQTIKILFQH